MTDRKPTADELAGMGWWNEMTEKRRDEAMQLGDTAGKGFFTLRTVT